MFNGYVGDIGLSSVAVLSFITASQFNNVATALILTVTLLTSLLRLYKRLKEFKKGIKKK